MEGEMMIFQNTHGLVTAGLKTQTRRLMKNRDRWQGQSLRCLQQLVHAVYSSSYKLKWQVGRTYAIQPGRGKKAVGRFLLESIRKERLRDISAQDARAELGWTNDHNRDTGPYPCFVELWDRIHTTRGTRWQDNPEVWVLTLRVALPVLRIKQADVSGASRKQTLDKK